MAFVVDGRWRGFGFGLGLGLLGCVSGCNGHRLIVGGSSQGEDVADDDGPTIPDVPEAELPPGCENGVLEPGDVCLVPEVLEWAGIDPCDISVGDFDRDGNADAAVPNSDFLREDEPNHVANVLHGTGDRLGSAVVHAAGGPLPVSVVTLDFDGDGWQDLAVGNSSEGAVTRLRNRGGEGSQTAGDFDEEVISLFADTVGTIAAGDLDGDGRDELLVPVAGVSSQLVIVSPDGVPRAYVTSEEIVELAARDVDLDGVDDVIAVTAEGRLHHLICKDDRCGSATELDTELYGFGELLLEDMNRDGLLDAVYTGIDGDGGVLGIALGDGTGGFERWRSVRRPWAFGLRGLVVEDFDRDGLPDVVLTESDADEVIVMRGVAVAEFETVTVHETGATPISAASADFDNDGLADVAVALQHANMVQVYMSRP